MITFFAPFTASKVLWNKSIGEDTKNQRIVMTNLGDLIRSIKDAFIDRVHNSKNFSNAPQYIIDVARELSLNAGKDADVFDKLLTPGDIEDEIKQRVNPILTSEEKAKADAVAKQIKSI